MTRTRAGIILQARYASSRLPGKALERIGQRTILEHCIRRLHAGRAGQVVLATTVNAEDDALAALATRLGIEVLRGDVEDVLGRFVAAAETFGLDPIVRATADNPAVDIDAAGRVIAALRASGADYVREDGLPVGAAVEGVTSAALSRASTDAHLAEDREHVTTFVRRNPQAFTIVGVQAPALLRRPDLRLTVDTPCDLAYVRRLTQRIGRDMPTLREYIQAAGAIDQPEVA